MGGPSLGSKRLPGKQTQTEKGVNNANARRSRAFRAGLVRAVALLHDRFLQQLRDGAAGSTVDGGHSKAKVRQAQQHLSDIIICHTLQSRRHPADPAGWMAAATDNAVTTSSKQPVQCSISGQAVRQFEPVREGLTLRLIELPLTILMLLSRARESRRLQRGKRRKSRAGSGTP